MKSSYGRSFTKQKGQLKMKLESLKKAAGTTEVERGLIQFRYSVSSICRQRDLAGEARGKIVNHLVHLQARSGRRKREV